MHWSTLAYVVFFSLAAAASFLLAFFATRLTSVRHAEMKRLQSQSAEAVAHAEAGAAQAHAQAELAGQECRRLEAESAQAQLRHDQLLKENLKLQLAVEKERARRFHLEELLGPRHIGASQRHTIESELSSFHGQTVSIIVLPGDPEIAGMAHEIQNSLESAGIAVSVVPALVFGKAEPGVSLDVGAHRRRFATALAKAFVDAGVATGPISASEAEDPDMLEITVGPKP